MVDCRYQVKIEILFIPGHFRDFMFIPGHFQDFLFIPGHFQDFLFIPGHFPDFLFIPGGVLLFTPASVRQRALGRPIYAGRAVATMF